MKTKNDYSKILAWAKKIKYVENFGNKCEKCGDDNIFHLIFHHINKEEKEYSIAYIRNSRWSKIESELKKCILLCQNCHRELHKLDNNENSRFNENKKIFLEFKNVNRCSKCGYDKYNGSLSFHHKENKNFPLNRVMKTCRNIDELSELITLELEKCDVLCSNCHSEHHIDKEFFEKNKKEILEKSKSFKEKRSKIDRNIVRKMYFEEGKRQIDIVNFLKCKKSTISDIIKELNAAVV